MAARDTVNTKDLTVLFYEKSFKVKDMHQRIWTGRTMEPEEMRKVAMTLQHLVDRGRYGEKRWREMGMGQSAVLMTKEEQENWQAQEIDQLRDEIEELKCNITDYQNNVHWLEGCAISGGD